MPADDVLAQRLTAQLLAGAGATGPVGVVERLLAVQAQDGRGARLAIRARTAGGTAAAVDRALTEDRSLVISWLNRGTLHLVGSEDLRWLHALTTPRSLRPNATRLAQEGVDDRAAERGVAVIERALAADGPLTREELRDRLDGAGIPTAGQALVHLLFRASLLGLIVRGPMVGGRHAFVLTRDWLGPAATAPVDRDRALAELARRYLAGHSPAQDRDLANWAGIGLREARRGLEAIASALEQHDDGLVALTGRGPAAPLPAPRLLGPFDPVLHGWRDRTPILAGHTGVITVNGIFRAIALVDGQAVGTWTLRGDQLDLAPFAPLPAAVAAALQEDARDVLRFLGR